MTTKRKELGFQSSTITHNRPPVKRPDQPTRTKQEFVEESDINTLMRRYERTGIAPPSGGRQPIFGDFTDPGIGDYAEALRQVEGVKDLMMRLPARVREYFANDPVNLLAFVQDPKNTQKAHELGLLREDYVSPSAPPNTAAKAPAEPKG